MEETLIEIKNELKEIKKKLQEIDEKCVKMSNHINFIESVYEKVKKPFNYLMNKVNVIEN
jgi:archaellum component FlaC